MLLRPVHHPTPFPLRSFLSLSRRNPSFLLHCSTTKRRRRRKAPRSFLIHSSLGDLITSPSSLYLLAPAIGFISGAALFLSSYNPGANLKEDSGGATPSPIGEWVLFSSPTPFNRSVLLRCPSVSFDDGGELFDGVNDRLVTESRHYINFSSGEIQAPEMEDVESEVVLYQRICVRTKDGGVLSVDWPESLDLRKEHGLDTTVVVVPGTTQGSMETKVKLFVLDALRHGYFPVVMNPRGCGGSPMTTPRLFTAADSDDISTVVRFLNTVRPWTTLVGVSWGYGSNMLTKYLAEDGDSTPLTAAVCIDSPFDLDEATRSIPHRLYLDQELLSGLIDIVQANKELFVGKGKGFDVQGALSAVSLRDFDEAISMVSHGCCSVEEFYAKISTRQSIHNVKTPVLFIESDNGTVPLFSIPRAEISENPFTSLLLCSYMSSGTIRSDESAVMWCQQLALEWLSAVELALLKGRHPLLEDIDISINPSKDFSFVNGRGPKNKPGGRYKESTSLPLNKAPLNLIAPPVEVNSTNGKVGKSTEKEVEVSMDVQEEELEVAEESQVLQTATVVMNMLDVTMPGTLNDEQKKKVLTAMERGETLMKALQEAVPEDVRGKLTTTATEIILSQKSNLSLNVLKRVGWTKPHLVPKQKIQEDSTVNNPLTHDCGEVKDANSMPEQSSPPAPENSSSTGMTTQEKGLQNLGDGETEPTVPTVQDRQENTRPQISNLEHEAGQKHASDELPVSHDANGPKDEVKRDELPVSRDAHAPKDEVRTDEQPVSRDAHAPKDGVKRDELPVSRDANAPKDEVKRDEVPMSRVANAPKDEGKRDEVPVSHDANTPKDELKRVDNSALEQSATSESHNRNSNEAVSSPQEAERQVNETNKSRDVTTTPSNAVVEPNSQSSPSKVEEPQRLASQSPSINVSQALDALTGFDDSTQVAVNSVFGVLENMIEQLEKNQGNDENAIDNEGSKDAEGQNIEVGKVEPINKSNVDQDEINCFSSSDAIEDDSQKEISKNSNISSLKSRGNQLNETDFSLDYVKQDYFERLSSAQNLNWSMQYTQYLPWYVQKQLEAKELESDVATDLILDPHEGTWKMANQARVSNSDSETSLQQDNVIEPSYVILEISTNETSSQDENNKFAATREQVALFIREELLGALETEVCRKLGIPQLDFEKIDIILVHDIEELATSVSEKMVLNSELNLDLFSRGDVPKGKIGSIQGEYLIKMVSCAVHNTNHLRRLLPMGLIVGSMLACLRKHFELSESHGDGEIKIKEGYVPKCYDSLDGETNNRKKEIDHRQELQHGIEDESSSGREKKLEINRRQGQGIMVGTVTAALGASALLMQRQKNEQSEEEIPSTSNRKGFISGAETKLDDEAQEKNSSLVSSLAEKAMSVAGPVVPTKGDGEVDHERLVAVLAELGQKGGVLRLVGKLALLWGGIRGAMSLTDRLISFLRIGERPLLHRLLGFVCMALLLWSPVVIPFVPTIVQSWSIKASTGIVGYACIVGLYTSVTILVMLWGKRIRGYDDPVVQYGLDLTSATKVQEFLKGLASGVIVVLSVHSLNSILGYACFSWPLNLPPLSSGTLAVLKAYGNMLVLMVRSLLTGAGVSLVEELLFRSWLEEEIAVDYGYYQAIMLSGIAFSLIHRSVHAVPGLFLLSIVLSGIKQRFGGKLAAPIGLRAGIMTTSYTLHTGGFVTYKPTTPFWFNSSHPLYPFNGAVGFGICLMLAIIFFPQRRSEKDNASM